MPQLPRRSLPFPGLFIALAVTAGLALLHPPVYAATTKSPSRIVGKATFVDSPSSEKPAAREKRLKRECRGRPNAGACLGHAS